MVQVYHHSQRVVKHPDYVNYARYPRVAYETIVGEAIQIEETLVRCGVSPTTNSRIAKYRRIIEEFTKKAAARQLSANFDWVLLHQALCEISQFGTIIKTLMQPPISQEWSFRLAQLVSGQVLPQSEMEQSRARDAQFELNIAAHCRAAGYAIESKEPDVLVRDSTGDFGIAAKRPKSAKTLERHIRKASKQIQKSGVDGIVAVDLSLIHNPENKILLTKKPEEGIKVVQTAADTFVELNKKRIRSLAKIPNVFGLLSI